MELEDNKIITTSERIIFGRSQGNRRVSMVFLNLQANFGI
jgi:hypothetical protein